MTIQSTDISVKAYASDSDPATLAANADAALVAAGYKYADAMKTGETKLTLTAGSTSGVGFYTKSGAPDVIASFGSAAELTKSPPSGVDAATYQKFADQFKGKKSGLVIFSATGVVAGLMAGSAATTTVAATTTAAAMTTTAAAVGTGGGAADWTQVELSDALQALVKKQLPTVADANAAIFVSSDELAKTTTDAEALVTSAGYTCSTLGSTTANGSIVGCTASGKLDILYQVSTISDSSITNNSAGMPADDIAKFKAATQGKKTLIQLVKGTGVIKALMSMAGNSTTAAATTTADANATTAAAGTGGGAADWTQVEISADSQALIKKQIPSVADLNAALFISSDDIAKTTADAQALVTGSGYTCSPLGPGNANLVLVGCTASGKLDVFYSISPITDSTISNMSGLTPDDLAKFKAAAQGKKSMVQLAKGTDLVKTLSALAGGSSSATTTAAAATTTAAATDTTTAAASGGTGGGAADWTQVDLSDALQTLVKKQLPTVADVNAAIFISSDELAKTVTDAQALLTQLSYTCNALTSTAQSSTVACSASGKLDIVYNISTLDDTVVSSFSTAAGFSADDVAKFKAAAQGKKSLVQLVKGTDLVKTLQSMSAGAGATTTTATGGDTPTPTPGS
jgi:hypothetical protein